MAGKSSGKKGKYTSSPGKGSYPRSAYTAYPDGVNVNEQHWDEHWHDEQAWNEAESYTGLLGEIED